MKRRALGAAFFAALISALTGSVAWADNPHGTPPGQAAQASTSASVSASASTSAPVENKGQAKKSEETSASTSAAGPSANASAQAHANATAHAQSNTAASATSKLTPGGAKFSGCTGTPNTSADTSNNAGVQPSSSSRHWTCASSSSNQTKMYGNGLTAGKGVEARGGKGATLYGPGNSQPHKVAVCPGSRHMKDWHAVKSFTTASCNQTTKPATPATSTSSTTNTSVSSSVTNNSTTNNSVTNNVTTNNSSVSNTSPSTSSGVQAAQKSSTPKAPAKSAAPAATTSPAASTAPASTKGVLGTTASPSSGTLPFTGLPLWLPALLAVGLAVTGYGLVRYGRSRA